LTHNHHPVSVPKNVDELIKMVSSWKCTVGLPPFTAFSSKTRIDISIKGAKPLEVLNQVGEQQQFYRSYGLRRNNDTEHKVNGKTAEQNFSPDHDLVKSIIGTYKSVNPTAIPQRAIFGLPHNYYFSSTQKKADLAPSTKDITRRASPLFIHVHQFPDKSVAILQMLIPAVFLPENTSLEYSMGKRDDEKVLVAFHKSMLDWQDITTYLNRFPERVTIQ
jgi:CRISPR-associated protein Cmr1